MPRPKRMLKCVVPMRDPIFGNFYMCSKCKHCMLRISIAIQHRGCKKKLFAPFVPEDGVVYKCKTCGRFFDNEEQFKNHEEMHKRIGGALDASKFEPVNL